MVSNKRLIVVYMDEKSVRILATKMVVQWPSG